jgi:3D (Asp-Asp-Asp) domain-containing protein
MFTNYKLISAVLIALSCPLFFSLNQGDAKVLAQPNELATYPTNMLVFEKSCILSSLAYNSPNPARKIALSKIPKQLNVVLTAYSSTIEETDSTPFITANGSIVRDGIVANNLLPFGTKIKIPELYGNRIFTVEDRMNAKKSKYHFDIWFPSHDSATDFGVKSTYIEIIES